jgi:hypothetical protein
MDMDRRIEMTSWAATPTPGGWIVGAVLVVLMLALVFIGGNANRTASNESPPTTTGMAPRAAPPLATIPPAATMPPAQSPSTTGQAR